MMCCANYKDGKCFAVLEAGVVLPSDKALLCVEKDHINCIYLPPKMDPRSKQGRVNPLQEIQPPKPRLWLIQR